MLAVTAYRAFASARGELVHVQLGVVMLGASYDSYNELLIQRCVGSNPSLLEILKAARQRYVIVKRGGLR
ncbi:hypothetical protein PCURB6_42930 [Paenibacillus curdlanolyticus]|nr:hypothetical protein PCURB6_42930 [Paenibacillus curdlanolyticus]